MKIQCIFSVLFALAIVSCGANQTKVSGSTVIKANSASPSPPKETPPQKSEEAETAPRSGTISRGDMNKVLADGPAALLGKVMTEPFFKNGKFIGFRITEFTGNIPEMIDLRSGDVVLEVNGRMIERPESYYEIFQELKVAGEIRFKLLRDGQEQSIAYPIVD